LLLNPYVFRIKIPSLITRNPNPENRSDHLAAVPKPSGLEVPVIEGGFPHSEIYGSTVVRTSP
jgi:hypothetical protein